MKEEEILHVVKDHPLFLFFGIYSNFKTFSGILEIKHDSADIINFLLKKEQKI